ncbi:p-aminobenzoyl-glutamate hydrolase subunit AbgA [Actinomadura miaoliensis]|uniref:p-aminobenzoyl-glutamate hydrolase subunit AbgA n=1 Tax=Actinomadura miaoliensis TaxID=430685 RepID=A0ABP7VF46_9ACTN
MNGGIAVGGRDVVGLRRLFHAHPETAFTEFWTSVTIAAELRRLGYRVLTGADAIDLSGVPALPGPRELARAVERARAWGADDDELRVVREGHTAVVAELDGGVPGPVTAVRVDIDALPLAESAEPGHAPAREGFASRDPEVMHACGHDGHIAVGLELARRLATGGFPGRVRLLFQPAEEGGRGARAMLGAGAVAGVDRLYALHLGLGLPAGEVAAGTSGFFANAKLRVAFAGRQAHAAHAPEEGRNALLAAAQAALGLHALPRFAAADTRVNVGMLRAGTAPNIVAADAELLLELRATAGDVCDELARRARAVLTAAGAAHEVGVRIERIGAATTAACDPAAVRAIAAAARSLPAVTRVHTDHRFGASDDATFLMRAVQEQGGRATFLVAGASSPAPHHSPAFDIDEACLGIAADTLERAIRAPEKESP